MMAILVCPLSRVPHMIETHRPDRVVSLLDPASAFPDAARQGVARHLKVGVNDITEAAHGQVFPMAHHVRDVLSFIEDWDRAAPVLVHCYAGISRSTATAFTIACVFNPATDEEEIALALRAASPSAWPNRRIVALADAELGRNGRMSAAIEAIGPGHSWDAIGEAVPFALPARFAARA